MNPILSVAGLLATFLLAPSSTRAASSNAEVFSKWSVDLGVYGFQKVQFGNEHSYNSEVRVAATNDHIGVIIGNLPLNTPYDPGHKIWNSPLDLTLLLFNAKNGRLEAKRGLWTSDFSFEFCPTAAGHFLLLLRHFRTSMQPPGETLYLLSASGEELEKMDLKPSTSTPEPDWTTFLISPSGHTVFLGQRDVHGWHCKILEADTLKTRMDWTIPKNLSSPSIVAASDKFVLGITSTTDQQRAGSGSETVNISVSAFDGHWQPVLASLEAVSYFTQITTFHPDYLTFLHDDAILGINNKSPSAKPPLELIRWDGTVLPSPLIPKLVDRTKLSGPVASAAAGRYFAVGFSHRPWLSHVMLDELQMDMTFQEDEFLFTLWDASNATSFGEITLGSNVRAFSFASDESLTLAFVNGSVLTKVRFREPDHKTNSQPL
jgi:hypothetical protein